MYEVASMDVGSSQPPSQLGQAMETLNQVVIDGLKHGFFDYRLIGDVAKGGNRRLTIKAGKSHYFVIPKSDVM
jgi:hypothetical protein